MSSNDVFGSGASRYKQYNDTATRASETEHEPDAVANDQAAPDPASTTHEETFVAPAEAAHAQPSPATQDDEVNPFLIFPDEFVETEVVPAPATTTAETKREPLSGQIVTAEDAAIARQATQSRSAWKSFLAKLGVGTGPSKAEIAAREAQQAQDETTIRQQTWTRAVNIGVLTPREALASPLARCWPVASSPTCAAGEWACWNSPKALVRWRFALRVDPVVAWASCSIRLHSSSLRGTWLVTPRRRRPTRPSSVRSEHVAS